MKKILVFVIALTAFMGWTAAQDTLVSQLPKSNCYYNHWLDSSGCFCPSPFLQGGGFLWIGVYFYTDEPLPVYGIAASLQFETKESYDTVLPFPHECFGLYRNEDGEFNQQGDSLIVDLDKDTVAYYFDIDMPFFMECDEPGSEYERPDPVPIYEYYYDEPVTVTDSFYLGMTQHTWRNMQILSGPDSGDWVLLYPKVVRMQGYQALHYYDGFGHLDTSYTRMVYKYYMPGTDSVVYRHRGYGLPTLPANTPYFFPILMPPAPPVDTTANDTIVVDTIIVDTTVVDTTGIDTLGVSLRLLERYVGLQPNPAGERVQVTSSFGLLGIELYNAAGVRVLERKATGYAATLDVRGLPAGPYLARIATPAGTVTKKLVIQRR